MVSTAPGFRVACGHVPSDPQQADPSNKIPNSNTLFLLPSSLGISYFVDQYQAWDSFRYSARATVRASNGRWW